MNSEHRTPSKETLSRALGAFSSYNTPALELAIASALMRNEGVLNARTSTSTTTSPQTHSVAIV